MKNTSSITLTSDLFSARYLNKIYQQNHLKNHVPYWPAASIYTLKNWLLSYWPILNHNYILLNAAQTQCIWQNIVKASGKHVEWSTAAEQTWQLCQKWQLDFHSWPSLHHEPASLFHQFATTYVSYCRDKKYIDANHLPQQLTQNLENHAKVLTIPQHSYLRGFYDLWPSLKLLFIALTKKGFNYSGLYKEKNTKNAYYQYMIFEQGCHELEAASRWAKKYLLDHNAAKVALIVPCLTTWKNKLQAVLHDQLSPHFQFIFADSPSCLNCPILYTALQLLELPLKQLWPTSLLRYLVQSPFINHRPSQALEKYFYEQTAYQLPPMLTKLPYYQGNLEQLKPISYWYQIFYKTLSAIGWPGIKKLTPLEKQHMRHWQSCLQHFLSLEAFIGKLNYRQAIALLHDMLQKSPFQPAIDDYPIVIMEAKQGACLAHCFDAIWIIGMTSQSYPKAKKMPVFIPHAHYNQIPQASRETELPIIESYLNEITQQISCCYVSYAKNQDDEQQQPHRWLRIDRLADKKAASYYQDATYLERLYQSGKLQQQKAPLTLDPALLKPKTLTASLLQNQLDCPFISFAKARLHACDPPRSTLGIPAYQRGIWMHHSLAQLWHQLKNQSQLLAYTEPELDQKIKDTVKNIIKNNAIYGLAPWLKHAEMTYLSHLIKQWLALEKSRPYFQVLSHETAIDFALYHQKIRLRLDRIDQLQDGRQLVIDYKSRAHRIKDCFPPYLKQLQLPLYALAYPDNNGIAFANLDHESMGFQGIMDFHYEVDGFQSIQSLKKNTAIKNWKSLQTYWVKTLKNPIKAFQKAYHKADPRQGDTTCKFCHMHPICRIKQRKYTT